MTYAELLERMSSAEFELWMALELQRQVECPNCGTEPRDMHDVELVKLHCPNCKNDYQRVKRIKPWRYSPHQGLLSEASPAVRA